MRDRGREGEKKRRAVPSIEAGWGEQEGNWDQWWWEMYTSEGMNAGTVYE